MRRLLGVALLLSCAAQPKAGRPYRDAPVAVALATGTAWHVEMGACLASFTGDATFNAVALSEMRVFAGDSAGSVHLLALRLTS